MSKMKHLLRKLHIGGGGFHDDNHLLPIHNTPQLNRSSPTPQQTVPFHSSGASTSSSFALPGTHVVESLVENSVGFNFFEDQFQIQLALAISVSDAEVREDTEMDCIKDAKQQSLGCSPSDSLLELITLQYWSNNVINYGEKVMDGFYDVYGITSNTIVQGKMPLLVDLQAISVSVDVGYEVILVNRTVDSGLQHLEEIVQSMSLEFQALDKGQIMNCLIQKIAYLVVDRMGGPVIDVNEMLKRWTIKSSELQSSLNTIVLPIGYLDVGLSRHRALLFKVLADKINFSCKLVKGSYYTGTDEGAVNFVKVGDGSEYIIDLMGAPGTLIPVEVPSCNLQDFGLDIRSSVGNISEQGKHSCSMFKKGKGKSTVSNNLDVVPTFHKSFEELPNIFDHGDVGQCFVKNVANPSINDEKGEKSYMEMMETYNVGQTSSCTTCGGSPVLGEGATWEISWEDLLIGERIGFGSYGEVYLAEWNGTEVAVKKFLEQDIRGDALDQFKCEVEIMLRLRHPNIVLFMGAVTRPPNLSILTEFLPRGCLYKLLHRPNIRLDEKRRIRMALDVAKGMNYLHTSHPVIVHRDLKTPNLLVDKNWVVKICDFGMSRLKYHTFLATTHSVGTAEWMAPEVLRNELANEKSDVYSFGVILWELATLRVPWREMNSMQVIGAVGYQNRQLDIPEWLDPMVVELINDCWNRDPQIRPSFRQIMGHLKLLHRLVVNVSESSKIESDNKEAVLCDDLRIPA